MSGEKRRRITIAYSARNSDEPERCLLTVEVPFHQTGISVKIEECEGNPSDLDSTLRTPDEQLETKSREAASKVLDEAANDGEKANQGVCAPSVIDSAERAAEIVENRLALLERIKRLGARGVRIAVRVIDLVAGG